METLDGRSLQENNEKALKTHNLLQVCYKIIKTESLLLCGFNAEIALPCMIWQSFECKVTPVGEVDNTIKRDKTQINAMTILFTF